RKRAMTGQLSLFDLDSDVKVEQEEYPMPDVGEYTMEEKLAFEKEVLGIYVSGHPLDAYEQLLKKNATVNTTDFVIDEETNQVRVQDGNIETLGGMITSRTLKTTRTNSVMAFITLEDMFGTVEIIVFPRDYEKFKHLIEVDQRVLIRGKVTVEEDKPAKMICQNIIPFDQIPREIWIKFTDKDQFLAQEQALYQMIAPYDGRDQVVIYCEHEKAVKRLPKSQSVEWNLELRKQLYETFSENNIKVLHKL
ncbi:MAG: OB-fold nucleic acid binding domain-containing protein, partial [Clostridiales bacterium]|nr:OB-fold nucleic acid binding domain-containing protein [Clostridiales bacterium]